MNTQDRTIEIIVSPSGTTRIVTRGYSGSACKDATKALEQALGVVQSDLPTPEQFESPHLGQPQRERQ